MQVVLSMKVNGLIMHTMEKECTRLDLLVIIAFHSSVSRSFMLVLLQNFNPITCIS